MTLTLKIEVLKQIINDPNFKDDIIELNILLDKYVKLYELINEKKEEKEVENKEKDKFLNIDSVLIEGARNGDLEKVKKCVENGANIHVDNDLALKFAAANGHLEVVEYFIENGANVCTNNDYALSVAAVYGHFEVVKYLVEHGADIHTVNDLALKYAIIHKKFEIVKYLVENGAHFSREWPEDFNYFKSNTTPEIVEYLKNWKVHAIEYVFKFTQDETKRIEMVNNIMKGITFY
jgi:ankyrin repeat protein